MCLFSIFTDLFGLSFLCVSSQLWVLLLERYIMLIVPIQCVSRSYFSTNSFFPRTRGKS